jgi:hypothetical protein
VIEWTVTFVLRPINPEANNRFVQRRNVKGAERASLDNDRNGPHRVQCVFWPRSPCGAWRPAHRLGLNEVAVCFVALKRERPLETRKVKLARVLARSRDGIVLTEHMDGERGAVMFKHACRWVLERIVSSRPRAMGAAGPRL